jgi:hypothetical protein
MTVELNGSGFGRDAVAKLAEFGFRKQVRSLAGFFSAELLATVSSSPAD